MDLTAHLPTYGYYPKGERPKVPKIPDQFIVKIHPDEDLELGINDTNQLRYFERLDSSEPFLTMGYSDTGFSFVLALMRSCGEAVAVPEQE